MAGLIGVDVTSRHSVSRHTRTLNAVAQGRLLSLVVKAFHPMFDLIERLLFPVESLDTGDVESVANQVGLDCHVQGRVTGHGWTEVDF